MAGAKINVLTDTVQATCNDVTMATHSLFPKDSKNQVFIHKRFRDPVSGKKKKAINGARIQQWNVCLLCISPWFNPEHHKEKERFFFLKGYIVKLGLVLSLSLFLSLPSSPITHTTWELLLQRYFSRILYPSLVEDSIDRRGSRKPRIGVCR